MTERVKRVSIVVPVYQNEASLSDTIPKLLSLQDKLPAYDLEIVFVDDGSTDGSYEIMKKHYQTQKDSMKIVCLTKNFGQNPAIMAGLMHVTGDCVGIISADLQDPYELFVDMVAIWEEGIKLVIAERESRSEGGVFGWLSKLYWKLVAKYAISDFPVGGFDFCLFDSQLCDDLIRINEKNPVIFPLIFWLGYDHKVLSYTRQPRDGGKSQWTFAKKLKLTVDTFVGFTYLPVRLITILGLVVSNLSLLYAVVVLVKWCTAGMKVQGWSTIVILVSLFGGLTLFSLGIIGEYLWRILDESRKRPTVVIDKVIA